MVSARPAQHDMRDERKERSANAKYSVHCIIVQMFDQLNAGGTSGYQPTQCYENLHFTKTYLRAWCETALKTFID